MLGDRVEVGQEMTTMTSVLFLWLFIFYLAWHGIRDGWLRWHGGREKALMIAMAFSVDTYYAQRRSIGLRIYPRLHIFYAFEHEGCQRIKPKSS